MLKLRLGKKILLVKLATIPDRTTAGLTNETADGFYVPFLDYDNIYFDKMLGDVKLLLQRPYPLNVLHICSTKEDEDVNGQRYGNYIVVGTDKLTFQQHYEMLCFSKCDRAFKGNFSYYKYKNWVLRMTGKYKNNLKIRDEPKFILSVWNDRPVSREQSLAHAMAYRKLLGIPLFRGRLKYDRNKTCSIIPYKTSD